MESASEQTFVGLDVHRKSVTATAFDAAGSRVSQERFGASDAELIDYLDRLPGSKHVVLEACTLWEHFYDAAQATGAAVDAAMTWIENDDQRRGGGLGPDAGR